MNASTSLPTDRGQLGDLLIAELPWLVRPATRLTRDADVVEDCAQETIVGAWRRADRLRDPAALRGWLRRSLVNRVIDRARVSLPWSRPTRMTARPGRSATPKVRWPTVRLPDGTPTTVVEA